MLSKTGVATPEQINSAFPSMSRLEEGPVAIVECFQRIPCNPCATACIKGAIIPFDDINNLPKIEHDNCNGCSLCVFNCPGLAIMVIDYTYSESHVAFTIPYEFLPLPNIGEHVTGLNRIGEAICSAEVLSVKSSKAMDRTPLIKVAVEKTYLKTFRNIKVVHNG